MKAPLRLGLFGLALAVVFAVAAMTASAVVPEETVRTWTEESGSGHHTGGGPADGHGEEPAAPEHEGHEQEGHGADAAPAGLGLEQDGYRLTSVSAPDRTGTDGALEFTITGPDGRAVTEYTEEHEQDLHLVVVRTDGQQFRHVHPDLGPDGTWSVPWTWDEAGSYRMYADTTPASADEGMTLTSTLQVAGNHTPVTTRETRTATTHGYDVTVEGDLAAGEATRLTLRIERDGEPVTDLEPHLGAAGHLVALREGDLAYLHVHPEGGAPTTDEPAGPEIDFEATAPTAGRYLLYLDFKHEGLVHSVPLVIDTTGTGGQTSGSGSPEHEEGETHDH